MAKPRSKRAAKVRKESDARVSGASRGTRNPKNLEAILANRASKPKLAQLRAHNETTANIAARARAGGSAPAVAELFEQQAKEFKDRASAIERDYAARTARGKATKAAKAEARADVLKALSGGRDELRAQARKLGIAGRSKMNVATLRSEIAKAASKLGRFGVIAAPAAAGFLAYDATRSHAQAAGADPRTATAQGAGAGLVAGGTVAAIGVIAAKAMKAAGPVVGGIAGKALLPVAVGVSGYLGYQKDGVVGAAKGVVENLTFGLAGVANRKARQLLLPAPADRRAVAMPRSPDYVKANVAFRAMQQAKARSNAPRGWANPVVQAAAQAAKGNVYLPK